VALRRLTQTNSRFPCDGVGANFRFDTLSDFERQNANLKVWCRACDHFGILHTGRVRRWFRCHGWNEAIEGLGRHMRCSVCHGRPGKIAPIHLTEPLTFPKWMEFEFQWGNKVKQLRNW
jgi:hypothetical protein